MSELWDKVRAEFACAHEHVRLSVSVSKVGARTYRRQCQRCGEGTEVVKASALTDRQRANALPWDEGLKRNWWTAKSERMAVLQAEERERELADWRASYSAYLQTPEWRRLRALVLERSGGLCEGCRRAPAAEIHHLTYERVGHEMAFDLVAVCSACHGAIHGKE